MRQGRGLIGTSRVEIARGLLAAAEAMAPEVLEDRLRARVSAATTEAVMVIQDQIGIAHCKRCPTRHGLQRKEGSLVCRQHHDARDGG